MECSFLDLRCKEVVNVVDGKRLGHIVDIVFDLHSSQICGLILPCSKGFWNVFKGGQDIFIPFNQICKIGEDTILVELYTPAPQQNCGCYATQKK
ncbi:MAG: YlmC/YmxH family sporulation protein [Clostridia bacterium]|nr:YlmC/YmxH family sporulation protein [Clostridia bacterium]MBR2053070.1 YlmC/YmxH family sporulation protein [Clostridia bacterium]MBR2220550.1 YlmC/YmxH family sporulation protein [Clostridia bacterium]MBR3790266.1 YlmC/YmxH family sporulation protein [Clostridia bacterium]